MEIEAGPERFAHLLSRFPKITYLNNASAVIDDIKFYGSPYSNEFFNWAFMGSEVELSKIWAQIPLDTNVLITHGPAYCACDLVKNAHLRDPHVGSQSLHSRKKLLKDLKYHISGHIHEAYGRQGSNINASVLNEKYQLVNEPIILEV